MVPSTLSLCFLQLLLLAICAAFVNAAGKPGMLVAMRAEDMGFGLAVDSLDPATGKQTMLVNLTLPTGEMCRSWHSWPMPASRKYTITCTFGNEPTSRKGVLDIDNPASFSWGPTMPYDNAMGYWNDPVYGDLGILGGRIMRLPTQKVVANLPDECITSGPESWVQWTVLDPVNHRYIVSCAQYNPPSSSNHIFTFDIVSGALVHRVDLTGLKSYDYPAYFAPDRSNNAVLVIGQSVSQPSSGNLTIVNSYTGVEVDSTLVAPKGSMVSGVAVDNSNLPNNRVFVAVPGLSQLFTLACPAPGQIGVCKQLTKAQMNWDHINLYYFPPA
jgi:hypothetical protein